MLNRKSRAVIQKTIAAAAATYTAGDQVGVPIELVKAFDMESGVAEIISVTLVDDSASAVSTDVFFFLSQPTVTSADQDPPAMTDAIAKATCIGSVNIPAANFKALGAGQTVGSVGNVGLLVKAAAATNRTFDRTASLWAMVVTRGTPTLVADGLTLVVGLER
jgi:hypothetical protein